MRVNEEIALMLYRGMVRACYNKNDSQYPAVGAKGIGVCKAWRASFKSFYKDMGDPEPGQVLLRKDKTGSFNPTNVTWGYP